MRDRGPESGQPFTRRMVNADAFWRYVAKGAPDECWVWNGRRTTGGYGALAVKRFRPGPIAAHRVSYVLAHGRIPAGKCVMHRCDNPPCVNPAHLMLGSHLDNMRDARDKGRYPATRGGKEFCKYGHHKGAKRKCGECVAMRLAALRREHVNASRDTIEGYFAEHIAAFVPPSLAATAALTDARRARVFARTFGLYGFKAETLAAIGADLGITRERTRQLRDGVLLKIGVSRDVIRGMPRCIAYKLAA